MDDKERRLVKERKTIPPGTRVRLVEMKPTEEGMLPGLFGTAESVDDAGTVHCRWDNGRRLGLLLEDRFEVVG